MVAQIKQMSEVNNLSPVELKRLQATLEEMKKKGSEDPIYFIDTFCYTFNPKLPGSQSPHLRFKLFPFQRRLVKELVHAIRNGEDLFIDKSREMGVTYTILATFLWFWLYEPSANLLVGSRKEDYVDNRRGGTTGNKEESLFGKLDYMLSRLPAFLMPKGFNRDKHFNYMSLVNPENGNVISGESSNPNFSRGGRQKAIFLDEFAFFDFGCYKDDTELLTDHGWMLVSEISNKDKVYSMNEDGLAEFMPVTDTQEVFSKELIEFENQSVNLHVTQDHNMLVKKRYCGNNGRRFLKMFDGKGRGINSNGQYYFRKARDIVGQQHDFIPLTSTWVGGDKPDKIYGFNSEDFMEFLGWFISEGYSRNKVGDRMVGICQNEDVNPEKCQQIRDLMTRMGLPINFRKCVFRIPMGSLPIEMFDELCSLGKAKDKHIPQKYLNLSKELLLCLLDSLIKGDGTRFNNKYKLRDGTSGEKMVYYTISKRLADNVQDLAQKVGMRARIIKMPPPVDFIRGRVVTGRHDMYRVNFGFRQVSLLANLKHKIVEYNRNAYCVTTPYHTLYVRRNGIASWCGNSQVWGATADTTNCRIVATTPGNKPSKAKKLRFGEDGEKIKVITLNYHEDPRKDKKWLDEQKDRRSTEDFDREIMVNWETSITGRVYPEIQTALYGDYPFLRNEQLYCSWDFGLDGTAIVFWQQNPANGKWRIIDCFESTDKVIQWFFPLFGKPKDSKFLYTDDDLKAINEISQYPPAIHFGDPDVKKRSYVAETSTRAELEKARIVVQSISKNEFIARRDTTKLFLQKGIEINASERTSYLLECLKSARYPQRAESSQSTGPSLLPIHDWTSHFRTSVEYFFINITYWSERPTEVPTWANQTRTWLTSRLSINRRK
jgi:hypothetical protein